MGTRERMKMLRRCRGSLGWTEERKKREKVSLRDEEQRREEGRVYSGEYIHKNGYIKDDIYKRGSEGMEVWMLSERLCLYMRT